GLFTHDEIDDVLEVRAHALDLEARDLERDANVVFFDDEARKEHLAVRADERRLVIDAPTELLQRAKEPFFRGRVNSQRWRLFRKRRAGVDVHALRSIVPKDIAFDPELRNRRKLRYERRERARVFDRVTKERERSGRANDERAVAFLDRDEKSTRLRLTNRALEIARRSDGDRTATPQQPLNEREVVRPTKGRDAREIPRTEN